MNERTVAALAEINSRFYDRHAVEFNASRQRPWKGWDRLVDRLTEHFQQLADDGSRSSGPLRVLDVGCGNGRFAAYLAERWPAPLRYLGLDGCQALLDLAAQRLAVLPGEARLQRIDLTRSGDLARILGSETFDLVVLFGVLHHLPGLASRRALLRDLAGHLATSGILAATVWQRHRRADFGQRVLPWSRYNRLRSPDRPTAERCPGEVIAIDQLDDGDVLLTWAGDASTPRYCHFPGAPEVAAWCDDLDVFDRYLADGSSGRENLYLVFHRTNPGQPP